MHQVAKDISGHGNDLPLVTPPQRKDLVIDKVRSQRTLLRAWAQCAGFSTSNRSNLNCLRDS